MPIRNPPARGARVRNISDLEARMRKWRVMRHYADTMAHLDQEIAASQRRTVARLRARLNRLLSR